MLEQRIPLVVLQNIACASGLEYEVFSWCRKTKQLVIVMERPVRPVSSL